VSVAGASRTGAGRAGLPWPEGDPGSLSQAAQSLGSASSTLRTTAGRLTAEAAGAADWRGQGAAAFQAAVADEHALIVRGSDGLEQGAAALQRLSRTLREAQELIDGLAREVIEAEEEAQRAAARAAVAQLESIAAGALLTLAGADPSPSLQIAADDAAADASAASATAGDAASHAQAVRERATRRAQDAVDEVDREDRATAAALDRAAAVAPLAGVPIGAPTPATSFGQAVLSPLSVEQWRAIAYWRAGIDGSTWDPSEGLWANDGTVQKVYNYYGSLFLDRSELQWAGMANIVGPMFYGGWQDLHAIRQFADREGGSFDLLGAVLPSLPAGALGAMPGPVRELINAGRDISAAELEYFEDQFLVMQKEIFDDLAWQHEAYMLGGAALMQDIHRRHPDEIDARTLVAWEDIASGDPDRASSGNEHLLRREQEQVIQEYYDEMRDHHGPVGDTATYAFSVMAENPLPGGQAYRDYDPMAIDIEAEVPNVGVYPLGPFGPGVELWDTPDVDVHQELPLPAGNLSNFDDRWAWIENDMLPAYRNLLADPGGAETMVRMPVDERASDFRKFPDFPYPGS
jgi:uncharacterized protein YukE